MNPRDMNEIADVIRRLATVRADLEALAPLTGSTTLSIPNQELLDHALSYLAEAEQAVDRVALGVHRKKR